MKEHDVVYLPNGQSLTVKPVFGGLFFRPTEQNTHVSAFPTGWTIIIQSEEYIVETVNKDESKEQEAGSENIIRKHRIIRYTKPTLRNDSLFISSISFPNSNEFKPAASPTRQIAMMLWATLYWYFHQPEPSPFVETEASKHTPDDGKPKGDWRISIKREGLFRGRNLLPKLERMGLISSEDSSVGSGLDMNVGWNEMFVSRRSFWQLSARLFLFTLSPGSSTARPQLSGSPYSSRPSSPVRAESRPGSPVDTLTDTADRGRHLSPDPGQPALQPPGPFASGSHLPTYYPPAPVQYVHTNGVRHPLRPKPPQQGETFYTRYIPSLGQHLTFRVASLSDKPVPYMGPLSFPSASALFKAPNADPDTDTMSMTDLQLLHKWMNDKRVANFWGCAGPIEGQEKFLKGSLESKHSFPAIGCWDGKPFGYFEIYWVKEDILGKHLNAGEAKDWDRGVHVLVGESEFRGKHRLSRWISALIHWALMVDYRTECLVLEPRVDNERYSHLYTLNLFQHTGRFRRSVCLVLMCFS
jgi:RimJ/RimL family protein N-acetyltransferase